MAQPEKTDRGKVKAEAGRADFANYPWQIAMANAVIL
jgi:hypothetical protein